MAEGSARRLAGRMIAWSRYFIIVAVVGLFSLFVDDDIPMPAWLRIRTLTDLKELLASVVVVLAVLFLGFALTWDGSKDLLVPGLSIAAVILALSVFLKVTHDGERAKSVRHEGGRAKAPADGEAPLT